MPLKIVVARESFLFRTIALDKVQSTQKTVIMTLFKTTADHLNSIYRFPEILSHCRITGKRFL